MSEPTWATKVPLTVVVRDNLRRLRQGRGWTQQRLAVEMQERGFDWTRSIVSNIETVDPDAGDVARPVTLAEVFALAVIFETTVPDLLLPEGDRNVYVGSLTFTPDEFTILLTTR